MVINYLRIVKEKNHFGSSTKAAVGLYGLMIFLGIAQINGYKFYFHMCPQWTAVSSLLFATNHFILKLKTVFQKPDGNEEEERRIQMFLLIL